MMLPSESRLTTDGQSVLPYGPGIHFGWPVAASTYATRLFVVPRSIPTVRPMLCLCLCQFFRHADDQIPNIRTPIQMFIQSGHDFLASRLIRPTVQSMVPIFRG